MEETSTSKVGANISILEMHAKVIAATVIIIHVIFLLFHVDDGNVVVDDGDVDDDNDNIGVLSLSLSLSLSVLIRRVNILLYSVQMQYSAVQHSEVRKRLFQMASRMFLLALDLI